MIESGGAPGTCTPDALSGAAVFRTASSTRRTCSVCEMAPPRGVAPRSHVLTGRQHTPCFRGKDKVLPAGLAPALIHLEDGCLLSSATGALMIGRAPQCCPELLLTPNQAGSLAPSRANDESGGPWRLCSAAHASTGHCAAITPRVRKGWVWKELHLRCLSTRHLFYRQVQHNWQLAHTHEIGCGTWSRTTMAKLMRLRRFPTFPRFGKWWTAAALHHALLLARQMTS